MAKRPQRAVSFLGQVQIWVDGLPRGARIGLNAFISLLVMVVLGLPIVLITAGSQVNEIESGEVLYIPTIVIAVAWLAIYGIGWWALVGFDWDLDIEWRAERPAVWMVLLGATAFLLIIFGCIFGLLFANFL